MSRLDDIREAAKQQGQQTGAAILQGPKPKISKDPYQAFGAPTADPQIRLIIYARKFFMMPQYAVLYDVFFDGAGEFVGLICPHHRIKIFGRNLMGLVAALRTNTVEWIREWDTLFEPVTDPSAPIITSIDVESVRNPFEAELNGSKTQ